MPQRLTYGIEDWDTYYRDAQLLWPGHYAELCQDKVRMPMGPAVDWYKSCDRAGILQIIAGRDASGLLAGYQISVIRTHAHYSSVLCAFEDTFWLDPLYRKGLEGVRLIKESLRFMRERGVQRVFFMSIESYPTDRIFQYLGFTKTHTSYSLWIGKD